MVLGDRIAQRREELLLTQDELAALIGVRIETFNNWEHGFNNPQKKNLQALARALQTTTDYLEGNTDIAEDYSSGGNKCIVCGEPIPYGIAKCPECCWQKWPASMLNSDAQSKRRKRSHSVDLTWLDRERGRAIFSSKTSWRENTYHTSLDMCTCRDFEERHLPCKHIYRLAEELGLIHCEDFAPSEDDYTMHIALGVQEAPSGNEVIITPEIVSADDTANIAPPAIIPQTPPNNPASNTFFKLLKFICRSFFCLIALFFILGALTQGGEWWCFPAGFTVAGALTALTADSKHLEGSASKWWLYGALVPVVSWIEVVMTNSPNKARAFMKGAVVSACGIFVFLAVFGSFLPPASQGVPDQVVSVVSGDQVSVEVPAEAARLSVDIPRPVPEVKREVPAVAPVPKRAAPTTSRPAREDFPVYLGERRVLIDPNEPDEDTPQISRVASVNVVITPKGKKYHYASCRTVRGRYTVLTVAQARKRGYTPCKVCSPPTR